MKLDPVCGMNVNPTLASASSVYEGETYYFCSKGCQAAFEKDPEKYIGPDDAKGSHGHHDHH
ncbi:MAG: YHS domain-containing protein [Brevefilum sp.]|nr:YHS domain-containing protein [Brevefilum sp.]